MTSRGFGAQRSDGERDTVSFSGVIINPDLSEDRATLDRLNSDPTVVIVDTLAAQLEELARTRRANREITGDEITLAIAEICGDRSPLQFGNWVFYPWRRALVRILPKPLYRELRLSRNQYKITSSEQASLDQLCIAIAGLSVGRSVLWTLIHEGIAGELRLADFDLLSLSNLNRISGSLFDIGLPKVVLAAREVAELDPYIRVVTFPEGVWDTNVAEFVSGADFVIDECDDLAVKLLLRERAKLAKVPVLMATGERGTLDIERFDVDPQLKPFYGLLDGVVSSEVSGLSTEDKLPYLLRIFDTDQFDERTVASLVEVKQTLAAWPQLASEVILGGAMVAHAVRRIALGQFIESGRYSIDLNEVFRSASRLAVSSRAEAPRSPINPGRENVVWPATDDPHCGNTRADLEFIVSCATRAPSGGNMQPWRFEASPATLHGFVDSKRSRSLLDPAERSALVALGAALEGAVIGAGALGFSSVSRIPGKYGAVWDLELSGARCSEPGESEMFRLLRRRASDRTTRGLSPASSEDLRAIVAAAAPLEVEVISSEGLHLLGAALGEIDRLRILSPRFRRELISELRWSGAEVYAKRDGVDVDLLGLAPAARAVLGLVRSGRGLDFLAAADLGNALRAGAGKALQSSGAAVAVRAPSAASRDIVDAGRGLMRFWLEATRLNLAVHPWGTPLVFDRLLDQNDASSTTWEVAALSRAAKTFCSALSLASEKPTLAVFGVAKGLAGPGEGRSLRREVSDVLTYR